MSPLTSWACALALLPTMGALSACTPTGSTNAPIGPTGSTTPTGPISPTEPTEPTEPTGPAAASVYVASAHLIRSCEEERAAQAKSAVAADMEVSAQRRASCGESTLQLSIENGPDAAATLVIESVVLRVDGAAQATQIVTSSPTRWQDDGGYKAWDGSLAAKESAQASFALAPAEGHSYPAGLQERSDLMLEVTVRVGDTQQVLKYRVPSIIDDDMVVT